MSGLARALVAAMIVAGTSHGASAHAGPPYPIVSELVTGPYRLSVWTDPDATDDGSAGGQFWVVIAPVRETALPADTRAGVTVTPLDKPGPPEEGLTAPVSGDPGRQFVALVMNHEGRFAVAVSIEGGLGQGQADAQVEATYDLRPAPVLLIVYLVPFVLVGGLWLKLLLNRRRGRKAGGEARPT
jgi:hypothetical protein